VGWCQKLRYDNFDLAGGWATWNDQPANKERLQILIGNQRQVVHHAGRIDIGG